MKALKLIGYWITSLNDEDFPPPQEFVVEEESSVREIVASYLDSGKVVAAYRGLSWCRFRCGDHRRSMGSCELSDGHWIWPEGSSHYVRDHNVRLPEEFITDAIAGRPTNRVSVAWEEAPTDVSFWREWCSRNRSGLLKRQLASARAAIDRDLPRLIAEAVDKIVLVKERRVGVSDSICLWEGCTNFALHGFDLCASCIARCLNEHQNAADRAYVDGLLQVLGKEIGAPFVGERED